MLVLTVAIGLLAYPIAYQACQVEFYLTQERFIRVLLTYTAAMIVAAILGAIADMLYGSREKPVTINFGFVAGFIIILALETMWLAATKPLY